MKYLEQTQVFTRTRTYNVSESRIQRICWTICSYLGVEDLDLAVQFVGTRAIRRLNNDFRGKDKPTDVLSFPQVAWQKPRPVKATLTQALNKPRSGRAHRNDALPRDPLGDLVICLDIATRNARHIGHPLDREVGFLLVHGILHLCGHDHIKANEEKLMLRCQRQLMKLLGEDTPTKALWRGCVQPPKRNSL